MQKSSLNTTYRLAHATLQIAENVTHLILEFEQSYRKIGPYINPKIDGNMAMHHAA